MSKTNLTVGKSGSPRLLAVDLRSGKLGFAVFEGPATLLDFGERAYARKVGPLKAAARRKFDKLLGLHSPSGIVIRLPSSQSDKRDRRTKIAVRILREEARRRSIPLLSLSRKKVKKFFLTQGLTTKHHIATHLAKGFTDLAWKLPGKRKLWQGEQHQMAVFDAVATGVAHFSLPSDKGNER